MIKKKYLMIAVIALMAGTLLGFCYEIDWLVSMFYYPLLAVVIVGVCTED